MDVIGALSPRAQRAAALIGIAVVAVVLTGVRYLGPSLAAALSRPVAAPATPPPPTRPVASVSFGDAQHGAIVVFDAVGVRISRRSSYVTSNGGRTWVASRNGDDEIAYLDRNLMERIAQNYQLSEDGGRTWRAVADPRTNSGPGIPPVFLDANDALWLDRPNFVTIQGPTGPLELWRTRDGGRTWLRQPLPSLPLKSEVTSVALPDAEHELLIDRSVDGSWSLFATADGGARWRRTVVLDPPNPDEQTLRAYVGTHGGELVAVAQVLAHAVDSNIGNLSLYVWHSEDGGLSWSRPVGGPYVNRVPGVFDGPMLDGGGRLVVLDNRRLWASGDGGVTWTARVVQMPEGVPPAVLVAGARDGSLFALASQSGTQRSAGPLPSRLLRSTDGGAHWDEVPLPKT
jgi:photosystem II stability/assembly factor-like uncharacterized protein